MKNTKPYIEFLLNGKKKQVIFGEENAFSPTTTVMNWLRALGDYNGVKEGCAEGDCGACTVVLGELIDGKWKYKAVTSCILFLPYLHGKHLFTVEFLSIQKEGEYQWHEISQILADKNASQCGYCTPGIAMSLYAFYKNQKKEEDIVHALSGNLCRCTGYESIRKAAVEIAGLSLQDDELEKQWQELLKNTANFSFATSQYYQPKTFEEALSIKQENPKITTISGATDMALLKTKEQKDLGVILDLSNIEGLKEIKKEENHWEIGAGVTIERLRETLGKQWLDFKNILDVFGSNQIRSVATIGGNLGSGSPIGDLWPLLMAHQAQIIIQSKHEAHPEEVEEFILDYRTTNLMPNELISRIIIPIDKGWIFWSEKVSKRTQLDISSVSAAFAFRLTKEGKIGALILAYGGMAAIPKRAQQAEEYLLGKPFEEAYFEKAAALIAQDFTPFSDARASKEGRLLIASNLLRKFFAYESGL